MAHLVVAEDRIRLNLSILETLGAVHGSPEIAMSEIESVEVVANPWARGILKGMRIGTGVPLITLLGTMKYVGGKDFCVIYRRRPNAVITLKSGPFKRWIFEIKDMSEIDALKKAIAS
ncbi:hypothetical protein MCEJIRE27_00400 [Candidatus Nanopelagicaceae bacterium]